jgi:hypothetical protein
VVHEKRHRQNPVTGFDSPKPKGGHAASSLELAVFLCPAHGIALFGGDVREALCLPVSFGPVCQPAYCRPFCIVQRGGQPHFKEHMP